MNGTPRMKLVRGWAILILGCATIAIGLTDDIVTLVMAGFSVLGVEPLTRARGEVQ